MMILFMLIPVFEYVFFIDCFHDTCSWLLHGFVPDRKRNSSVAVNGKARQVRTDMTLNKPWEDLQKRSFNRIKLMHS